MTSNLSSCRTERGKRAWQGQTSMTSIQTSLRTATWQWVYNKKGQVLFLVYLCHATCGIKIGNYTVLRKRSTFQNPKSPLCFHKIVPLGADVSQLSPAFIFAVLRMDDSYGDQIRMLDPWPHFEVSVFRICFDDNLALGFNLYMTYELMLASIR